MLLLSFWMKPWYMWDHSLKDIEQYFHMVLFPFKWKLFQEQYFHVVQYVHCMLYKLVITFMSVDNFLVCDHSNENSTFIMVLFVFHIYFYNIWDIFLFNSELWWLLWIKGLRMYWYFKFNHALFITPRVWLVCFKQLKSVGIKMPRQD